jgi:site-specific recombinase XerD
VQGFRHWLSRHRGASETTRSVYSAAAVELLRKLGDDPGQYDAKHLRAFLLDRARRRGVGGTKAVLSALRMFLRYLATQGKCQPGLDAAIPAIAGWRLATLPRCLSVDEVGQLLLACDLTSLMGLRDHAVILLLARLGLRASDVAALRFADIDWRDGSILVTGKSRREARLPLPQEVGDAILAYLQRRPHVRDERVFLRCVAPFRGLQRQSVSQIVRRNMRRAGLTASAYGSHILRHSAATEMLRQGVSLYDIGVVLRHQSADMSAYYAKVDMELLKQVVQPWPEVLSC